MPVAVRLGDFGMPAYLEKNASSLCYLVEFCPSAVIRACVLTGVADNGQENDADEGLFLGGREHVAHSSQMTGKKEQEVARRQLRRYLLR